MFQVRIPRTAKQNASNNLLSVIDLDQSDVSENNSEDEEILKADEESAESDSESDSDGDEGDQATWIKGDRCMEKD